MEPALRHRGACGILRAMKRFLPLPLLLALALPAAASTTAWTYVPGSPRGTISWTDPSGFENVVKGIVLDGTQIKIKANENRSSTTLKNADFSVPVEAEDGSPLSYSPDFLAGDNANAVLGYIAGLTNIVVNANATSLGRYCFKGNTGLVRVRLNDGLVSIGPEGFNGCTALETIDNFFPDSLESVGSYAFNECNKLAGVCVANGLVSIADRGFKNCYLLSGFDGSASPLESIGLFAFFGDKGIASVALPDTLATIEGGAFNGCKSLRTVTPLLPPNLATFGTDNDPAWGRSAPLEGHVFSPYTLQRIGVRAFHSTSVETFTAARKGLKTIGQFAFYGDTKITNVVLSATMEGIEAEWLSNSGTAGVEQHVWFRNLPESLPSDLWTGTKAKNITVHLPWSKQKEWREWVASAPSGHTFKFNGVSGTLPEHRNDIGTWTAGKEQYVTWWKDSDSHFAITVR